jgi:hypothetical protein
MDIAPMDPCPAAKRHLLNVVLPEEMDGDMTFFCERCGALRRVPVAGSILPDQPLDDLTAADIAALAAR